MTSTERTLARALTRIRRYCDAVTVPVEARVVASTVLAIMDDCGASRVATEALDAARRARKDKR
jgi:hypothetical protein